MYRLFLNMGLVCMMTLAAVSVSSCGKDDEIKTFSSNGSQDNGSPSEPGNDDTPSKEPAGTAADPYRIASASDWRRWMTAYAKDSNRYFRLTAPIELNATVDTFCGKLDGNGYSISVSNRPIFKVLDGAEVSNLLVAGTVTGFTPDASDIVVRTNEADVTERFFGGLVCRCTNGTLIQNCVSRLLVSLNSSWFGYFSPLCGIAESSTISNCLSEGSFRAETAYVGGIVSLADSGSVVSGCGVSANMSSTAIGGVVYRARCSSVSNCYAVSALEPSQESSAGVVGICEAGVVDNCYFYGTISSSTPALVCFLSAKNGVVRYCYGGLSEEEEGSDVRLVWRTSSGGMYDKCYRLFNALQLEVTGPYGRSLLVDELNARAAELGTACRWTVKDNQVVIAAQ